MKSVFLDLEGTILNKGCMWLMITIIAQLDLICYVKLKKTREHPLVLVY